MVAAVPSRTDGVDHVIAGKLVGFGDLCFTGFAAAECDAFCQKSRTGSAVDGTVNSASAEKTLVCCIYDCRYVCDLGYVAFDCVDYMLTS